MPRFFFDLSTPEGFERDGVGLEYPSVEKAYLEASRAAVDIGAGLLHERKDPHGYRFEIRDGDGRVVIELPFGEALQFGRTRKPPTADAHERLRLSLERSRRLKKELAHALAQARANAQRGLKLAQVAWPAPMLAEPARVHREL